MLALSDGLCQWHRHWVRLIEQGAPGRDEREEFFDWLEQFRPWGPYGHDPGQWWADGAVLWTALRGTGANPVMTGAIYRELDVRSRICQRLAHGLGPIPTVTWTRCCGWPLPEWSEALAAQMVALRVQRPAQPLPPALREPVEQSA